MRRHVGPSFQIVEVPAYVLARNGGPAKRQPRPFVTSYLIALTKQRFES